MSSDVTTGLTPDRYGQLHPVETDDLIRVKLDAFETELDKVSDAIKATVSRARVECPELLTRDFKLMFLRSEVFNADVSFVVKFVFVFVVVCLSVIIRSFIHSIDHTTHRLLCVVSFPTARRQALLSVLGQAPSGLRTGQGLFTPHPRRSPSG